MERHGIPLSEYTLRRRKVMAGLKGAIGVVLAGEGAPPLKGQWTPDWDFCYLTGIRDEAGAALLLDPKNPNPKHRCILFLRPLNPERERWDGYRQTIGSTLKEQTGFETIMRADALPRMLTAAAKRTKRVACLHPFAVYPAPVSPDLALCRQLAERIAGVAIEDQTELLPGLRAVKSRAELKLMRRAIDATEAGYRAVLNSVRPGMTERQVQVILEDGFRSGGGTGIAYNSIVGSGFNATVLHYMANHGVAEDGDLLLIDAGAECEGYAADITRTFPVSGRFTKEQRELYNVVLRAQRAAIAAVRPGAKNSDVDAAARDVIDKAGYGDSFIHGTGHQLGLEVHDVTPEGPLREGMVITIEPGVYFPERKLGIRVEDDVLVTARGAQNLSPKIPKSVQEIEAAMMG